MSNINVVRKNLGPVTAYKYAVQQGYTGTEQEFAALMASYATVAQEAEAAKDDAVIAKIAAEAAQAAAEAAAEQAEGAIEVDDTLSVRGRAADAKVTGDKISGLKTSVDNYIETKYAKHVKTESYSFALLRFNCPIKTGDSVTVNASYTGSNASKYDIRFYEEDETIHIIKTSQPFDNDYTFTAVRDYEEASLFCDLGTAEPGETFAVNISIPGKLLGDVSRIGTDIQSINNSINDVASEVEKIKKSTTENTSNAYDGITLISGRVYNGVFSDAITTVHCTDYMPIIPGHMYAVYGGYMNENYTNYYNSDKEYQGALPLENLKNTYPYDGTNNHLVFTAPADAYFTRINFMNNALVDGDKLQARWYFRDITNLIWAQKRVLVIGDSISTDVYGGYKKWVTNFIDEGYFTKGLVSNDSQHATGFVATYNSQASTTFINRIQTHTPSDFDAIVIFGGINDYIQSIDFDTFKTAVDTFFAYVAENYYHGRIAVFSPLRTSITTANSAGHIQQDYADYIQSVAKSYCFPVLNLTEESGFYPFVEVFKNQWTLLPEGYTAHDGVHPTAEWEKYFLCPMIKKFLNGLY